MDMDDSPERLEGEEKEPTSSRLLITESGNYGDDFMTPPDALLKEWLDRSKKLAKEEALEGWIRCTALARIVHGDTHWMLAMTHTQLGWEYLKRGLNEQALIHSVKGRDIFLLPINHVMSHDSSSEAVYNLSLAHYIIGQVQTTQKKEYKDAEKSLHKAQKVSEQHKPQLSDDKSTQLSVDILSVLGRLYLEQGDNGLAREHFQKAVDLSRNKFDRQNNQVVRLLRGLATATLRDSGDKTTAVSLLEEALQTAESNFGATSEEVGDCLLSLGRAHSAAGPSDTVEEYYQRAHSVYCTVFDQHHRKAVGCKDDLCKFLVTKPESHQRLMALLKELIAEKKVSYGESSMEVGESLNLLGTVQLKQGEVKQAIKSLTKAKIIFTSELGAKHKDTVSISNILDTVTSMGEKQTTKPVFLTTV